MKMSLKLILKENEERQRRENIKRKFDAIDTMNAVRMSPSYSNRIKNIPIKKLSMPELMAKDAIDIVRRGMEQRSGNPKEIKNFLESMLKQLSGARQYTAAAKSLIADYIQAELSGF